MNGKLFLIRALILTIHFFLQILAVGQVSPCNCYEAYYLHLNAYPENTASWGKKYCEVQGITHDDSNWYITATERKSWLDKTIVNCFLWKIPLKEDLDQKLDSIPGMTVKNIYDFCELWNSNNPVKSGWNHWGDLDHYHDSNGIDYLVVPVMRPDNHKKSAIVIFRAHDLTLAGFGILPGQQGGAGWCAVEPHTGNIFTSNHRTSSVYCYDGISWKDLPTSGLCYLALHLKNIYNLIDGKADTLLDFHNMQGGEFTPSGELLYLSSGRGRCKTYGADDPGRPTDGINVFDTKSWHRIKHSTNRCYAGPGNSDCGHSWSDYFDFTYDFLCGWDQFHSEQPEGLTIWDVDGLEAPHVGGQLHVLIASVGIPGNRARLVHYSNKLRVDSAHGSEPVWPNPWEDNGPLAGSESRPFKTITDAIKWYPVWDGAEILIKDGSYPVTSEVSIGAHVRFVSQGGSVIKVQ